MKHPNLVFLLLLTMVVSLPAKTQNRYLHSKEGTILFKRIDAIIGCFKEAHQDLTDTAKAALCKCTIDLMNRNFTDEQIKRHAKNNGEDIQGLFSEDSTFARRVHDCWTSNDEKSWLSFQQEYVSECKKTLQEATQKKLDTARFDKFARCQLEMVLSNEVPYTEMKKLNDPNSDQFHQVTRKCGSPFSD